MSTNTTLILSYGSIILAFVLAYAVPLGFLGGLPLVFFGCYLNRRAVPRRPRPSRSLLAFMLCSVAVFGGAVFLHLFWLQIITLIIQLAWAIWYEFRTCRSRKEHAA